MILQNKKYGYIDMVTLSIKTSPLYSVIFATQIIIDALLPMFQIFVTANFINSAMAIINRKADISSVYIPTAMLAGIMIYHTVVGSLMNFVDAKRSIYFRNKLVPEIIRKQASLKYWYIENSETADLINRITPAIGIDGQIWSMYTQVLNAVNFLVYVLGIIASLFTQVWWISISMLLASIPLVYFATKAGNKSYEADKEMSRVDRKVDYLSHVMRDRETTEERTIFGYTDRLNAQYSKEYEFARIFRQKVTFVNFIKMKSGGIFTTAYSAFAMIALLIPAKNGSVSIGMFIALMGAVFELAQRLSWGVNGMIQDLSRKREYLRDLTKFMALEEHPDACASPQKRMSFKKIEFCDVSFIYPNTNKVILDKVSFTIEYGKNYSFVGVNGAGKTTITKLLTGLYTNYSGKILVDGRSLRDLTQSEIKGLSSVVYQDFARYYISLFENIAIADLKNYHNQEKVEEIVALVGLKDSIAKLANGLDTPLGKVVENGVDLSVGEWQRVAMARGIMGASPLIILDEPTAALDPMGESEVYRNFRKMSGDITTILISHRLGSTKLADVIYVLSDGKIVEQGSHRELMKKNGMYSAMYDTQASWYKNDKIVSRGDKQ